MLSTKSVKLNTYRSQARPSWLGISCILIALACALTGCGVDSPRPVSSATSKFEAAGDETANPRENDDIRVTSNDPDSNFADRGGANSNAPWSSAQINGENVPADSIDDSSLELVQPLNAASAQRQGLTVPDGNPEQLLEFISGIEEQVASNQIAGSTSQEKATEFQRLMQARKLAAERILEKEHQPEERLLASHAKLDSLNALAMTGVPGASRELLQYADVMIQDPEEDLRIAATLAKMEGLTMLATAGDRKAIDKLGDYVNSLVDSDNEHVRHSAIQTKLTLMSQFVEANLPNAKQKVIEFAQPLAEDANPQVAEVAQLALFSLQLRDISTGENNDIAAVVEALRTLLQSANGSANVFETARIAVFVLARDGHTDEAAEARKLISQTFEGSENESLALAAQSLESEADLMDFQTTFEAVMRGDAEKIQDVVVQAKSLLAEENPGPDKLSIISQAVFHLEFSGNVDAAAQIYDAIDVAYKNHEDERLARAAGETVEYARRRIDLVGKPIELTGVQSDGEPFDSSRYQGKIVLVDFWATWCPNCVARIPEMKKYYEQYQQQGFEVVGVNMDDAPEDALKFIEKEEIPWVNVMSDQSGSNQNAVRYAVEAIPYLVLVGRDGNVAATHVQGDELGPRIKEMFAQSPVSSAEANTPDKNASRDDQVRTRADTDFESNARLLVNQEEDHT